jgi:hypothetical protein
MAVTFLVANLEGGRRCHKSWTVGGVPRAYEWSFNDLGRILSQVHIDVKSADQPAADPGLMPEVTPRRAARLAGG